MFNWLFETLGIEQADSNLLEEDSAIGLCLAVLLQASASDGDSDPQETGRIIELIQQEKGVDTAEALKRLTAAASQYAKKDSSEIMTELGWRLSDLQREKLLTLAIKVVKVDEKVDRRETAFIGSLITSLGLSEESVVRAYEKARVP